MGARATVPGTYAATGKPVRMRRGGSNDRTTDFLANAPAKFFTGDTLNKAGQAALNRKFGKK